MVTDSDPVGTARFRMSLLHTGGPGPFVHRRSGWLIGCGVLGVLALFAALVLAAALATGVR